MLEDLGRWPCDSLPQQEAIKGDALGLVGGEEPALTCGEAAAAAAAAAAQSGFVHQDPGEDQHAALTGTAAQSGFVWRAQEGLSMHY
jgi:hypothetical protein